MLSGFEKLKSSLEIWMSHETRVVSSAQQATLEAMVASISAIGQQVAVVKQDFQPLQQKFRLPIVAQRGSGEYC